MRYWTIFLIIIFLIKNENSLLAKIKVIDKIVAVVNNNIILDSDVQNMIKKVTYKNQNSDYEFYSKKTLYNDLLNQMIIIQTIMDFYKNKIFNYNPYVKENLEISLNQENIKLSQIINNNKEKIYKNSSFYQTNSEEVNKSFLIDKIIKNEVNNRIRIFPEEINSLKKQFINDYNKKIELKLNHIFIPFSESQNLSQFEKTKSLANVILEKLKNEKNLKKIMIELNNNLKIIKNELIYWKRLEELPSIFSKYLNCSNIMKNKIIGPIRSGIGFHILKIEDVKDNNPKLITKIVHIRHIFIKPSILKNDTQIYYELSNILRKIKNGEVSFNVVAKRISEDYTSANKEGDLGWFFIEKLDSNLKNVILSLNKLEISKPVRSNLGWHLFQIIDLKECDCTDFLRNNQIENSIFNHKLIEEASLWIKDQISHTYIKVIN